MNKNRLEAFSDGVFAIVITLLILDVKLPVVAYNDLYGSLVQLLPNIGIYVLSFLLIGMYWVFHHQSLRLVGKVNGVLLWLNIFFLLFLSFLPFPTSLMGRYPSHTIPIVVYGVNLLVLNLIGYIVLLYLRANQRLASSAFTEQSFKLSSRTYLSINGLYILCIALGFIIPTLSYILLALMAVLLILRSAKFVDSGNFDLAHSPPRQDSE